MHHVTENRRRPALLCTVAVAAALAIPSASLAQRREPAATAQRREPAPQSETAREQTIDDRDANQTRQRLSDLLQQYPPSLRQVLRLDPSLLSNAEYLAPYPGLLTFLGQHPEVAHNPSFFIGAGNVDYYDGPRSERRQMIEVWAVMMATVAGFTGALIIISVLGWLIRTLIDYRRWLRLSRIQTDVHTKLLDRFTANEDLLAYIQTSAGKRFLESAPIPIDAAPRAFGAPIGRILWSVQAGVVLAIGGAGLSYVSGRVLDEMQEPLFVIGALGMAVGLGFIVSAIVAFFLTRRLGLLEPQRRDEVEARTAPSV